jgi:hypothetical protein
MMSIQTHGAVLAGRQRSATVGTLRLWQYLPHAPSWPDWASRIRRALGTRLRLRGDLGSGQDPEGTTPSEALYIDEHLKVLDAFAQELAEREGTDRAALGGSHNFTVLS